MDIQMGPVAIIAVCITIVVIMLTFKNEIKRLMRARAIKNSTPSETLVNDKITYSPDDNLILSSSFDDAYLQIEDCEKQKWLIAFNKQDYDLAYAELEKYIATLEGPTDVLKNKCILAFVNSMTDFDHAVELFIELMDQFPSDENVYIWFSKIYSWNKLYLQAITIIDAGLEVLTKNPNLILLKAEYLGKTGSYQDGIECILSSIDKKAYSSDTYSLLAKLYKKLGDSDEQIQTLIKGYQMNRLDDAHLLEFARELELSGKLRESLYILKHLEKKNPKDPTTLCYIGNAYFKLGLNDLALNAYTEADKVSGGNQEWIKANIGNLYQNIGFYSTSTEYLKKAVKISAEYEYALERLTQAVEAKNKDVNLHKEILRDAQQFFIQRL